MKAVQAGIVATIVFSIVMYINSMIGLGMNVPEFLAGTMGGSVIVGWIVHFAIGIIWAFIYAGFLNRLLPISNDILRGLAFGVIVFIGAQVGFAIGMGMGMMPAADPNANMMMMMIGGVLTHLTYGATFGFFFKREAVAATTEPTHSTPPPTPPPAQSPPASESSESTGGDSSSGESGESGGGQEGEESKEGR